MKTYTFQTSGGVCPKQISFAVDAGKVYSIKFFGGCPGNTGAISKLLEGVDAKYVIEKLKGNPCGNKGTSCADQLAIAVEQVLKEGE